MHPHPEDGGSGSVVEAVSTEQSLEMRSYRPGRYPKLPGDFFIWQSRGDPVQDLRLAGRHPEGRRTSYRFCPNDRYTPGQGETILETMADGGRVARTISRCRAAAIHPRMRSAKNRSPSDQPASAVAASSGRYGICIRQEEGVA